MHEELWTKYQEDFLLLRCYFGTANDDGSGISGSARDWALARVRSLISRRSGYVSNDFVVEEECGASA
ncbi:hypothetical protein VNO80_09835 [Phaseolus coccineus]|uniref:Uncharacterized protein n=1 Tax=Phaseolus coccineus TaxID=3886 RepID=A0AAN9RD70_PHACN